MRIQILVAIVCLAGSSSIALAKSTRVHTASVEIDSCLPIANSRVLAGTAGGLLLIGQDNRELKRFTALDGLPGTRIHALAAAKRGVWVATEGGAALVSLQGKQLKVLESFTSKAVRGLHVQGKTLYVATWGQGLLRYQDGRLESVGPAVRKRRARVTSVTRHQGRLWWTTAGAGLWRQSAEGISRSQAVPKDAVLWAVQSDAENLWISGEHGVSTLKGDTTRSLRGVRSTATVQGIRHAASFGAGLRSLDHDKRAPKPPSDRYARSLATAHGVTCMGTQDRLWLLRDKEWEQAKLHPGIPSNDIAAFASSKGQAFVGTFDQGVAVIKNGKAQRLAIEIDPHVNVLAIDAKSGGLWIGTSTGLVHKDDAGLHRYNRDNGLPSHHIMSLFALPQGGVLVGTAAGAALVRDQSVDVIGGKKAISTGNVWAVAQSADGASWLGTRRGLFRVLDGKVSRYRVASGHLPDDWVMALAVADDGIFVGTYKSGVVRLAMDGDEATATTLGEGWINPGGLRWDGTKLWAATMGGPRIGDGRSPSWDLGPTGPGKDTTAFVPTAEGAWLATRRGIVHLQDQTLVSR